MEAEQQPFEVRREVHEPQVAPTRNRLGIAAGGAVLQQPVGVEKDEGTIVPHAGLVVPSSLLNCVLDHPAGISSSGNDDIEMKVEALLVAKSL